MAIGQSSKKTQNKTNLFEQKKKQDLENTTNSIGNPKIRYIKGNFPGMKGKMKIFDQNLSDRYDIKARKVIKKCLGNGVVDNPHVYGEDMLVLTDRIPYGYIELQVYGKWVDDVFPYPSPYIYERKMRFNPNTLFVCFNASFSKAIIFSKSCVDQRKYRAKKYSREFVHYVAWHKTLTVDVSKLTYDRILSYCDPEKYLERLEQSYSNKGEELNQEENIIDIDDIF